jgi:hypothetical protein
MLYKIYEEETNKTYNLSIVEIINLIKLNLSNTFYKFIDNENNENNENNEKKIKINNNIVLNTQFICHRINTVEELEEIDNQFGIELDLRDDHKSNKIILSHEPFSQGEFFEDYLQNYKHNTLILNIKSERIELECLKLLEKYNINNYFFLDSSFPMIYLLNKEYKNNKIACRFSEYEPIQNFLNISNMYEYIWVDCFTKFPLTNEIYNLIKNENQNKENKDIKKICIVSPELQKKPEKIEEYREYIISNSVFPDLICCKSYNIIRWI